MFISLDGVDGGGKSTQIRLLEEFLSQHGNDVTTLRDPGGTRLGESVREILLHRHDISLEATAEMLLYMASRAQLVREQIRPALELGRTVISDRFLLANVVYQGHGGGLPVDEIWQVGRIATDGLEPDLTIILDLPVEIAMTRLGTEPDRLERRGLDYFSRVRNGFLTESRKLRNRVKVIDATDSIEAVHSQILAEVQALTAESV